MEPVIITISHKLGKEEVLRRLQPGLGQISKSFPVLQVESESWDGDRMDFRIRALGQAVSGNVEVFDDSVRVEAALPWLLARFADVVKTTIASRGQILLEKK